MEACRIFNRRISATDAAPTPISAVEARNARYAARRCSAVSFFESSSMPASSRGTRRPRTTAAATTGPASGPRPASSTPATRPPAASSIPDWALRPPSRGSPSRESDSSVACRLKRGPGAPSPIQCFAITHAADRSRPMTSIASMTGFARAEGAVTQSGPRPATASPGRGSCAASTAAPWNCVSGCRTAGTAWKPACATWPARP